MWFLLAKQRTTHPTKIIPTSTYVLLLDTINQTLTLKAAYRAKNTFPFFHLVRTEDVTSSLKSGRNSRLYVKNRIPAERLEPALQI
jgi:hypothetical protein